MVGLVVNCVAALIWSCSALALPNAPFYAKPMLSPPAGTFPAPGSLSGMRPGRVGAQMRVVAPVEESLVQSSAVVPEKKAVGWSGGHYRTLATMYLCYAIGMYGKGTMSLAFAVGMSQDAALALSTGGIAQILAVGQGGYTFGKFVGGPITDALGTRKTLALALSTIGAAMVAMAWTTSMPALCVLWGLGRFMHSLTWPGIMQAIKPWFGDNGQSKALGILTSSSRMGAFVGSLLGGILLVQAAGWRGVAVSTGAATLAVAALAATISDAPPAAVVPKDAPWGPAGVAAAPLPPAPAVRAEKKLSLGDALRVCLREPKYLLVVTYGALLCPVFDLAIILPFFMQTLGMQADQIGRLCSVYALAAVPIVIASGQLHAHLAREKHFLFYGPLLFVAALALAGLGLITTPSPLIPLMLVAIMGGVAPALYIPNYDFLLRFGGPFTGTLTSIMDFCGNSIATAVLVFYPRLLAVGGWRAVFGLLGGMAAVSAACVTAFTILEAREPTLESPLLPKVAY